MIHKADAGKRGLTWEAKYELHKQTYEKLQDFLRTQYSTEVPILNVFGNNDNFQNYQPLPSDYPVWGGKLYELTWKVWYEDSAMPT